MSRYVDVDRPVEELSDAGGFARHIHGVLLDAQKDPSLKFVTLLFMQKQFSEYAFGPHSDRGVAGNIAHIRKELDEIEDAPLDLTEWCDVILLAMDGAARAAACAGIANPVRRVAQELFGKLAANMQREWPEWRGVPVGQAIEHVRADELAVDGRPYPDVLNTALDDTNLEASIKADYGVVEGIPFDNRRFRVTEAEGRIHEDASAEAIGLALGEDWSNVEALQVGQFCTDSDGWKWERTT